MLDGATLHHAFGLSWGKGMADETSIARSVEHAKKMLQMRKLIVDEISMVSVELLARLERACRNLVLSGSPFKRDAGSQRLQPFGGLNVRTHQRTNPRAAKPDERPSSKSPTL